MSDTIETYDGKGTLLSSQPLPPEQVRGRLMSALESTDARMPRALEDVIDLMIAKGVIATSDLPVRVIDVVATKKFLRSRLGS